MELLGDWEEKEQENKKSSRVGILESCVDLLPNIKNDIFTGIRFDEPSNPEGLGLGLTLFRFQKTKSTTTFCPKIKKAILIAELHHIINIALKVIRGRFCSVYINENLFL